MIRISGQDKRKLEPMCDLQLSKIESLHKKEAVTPPNQGTWFNDGTAKIQNKNLEY